MENRALLAPAVQFHHEDLPGVSEAVEKNEEESAMKIYPWMKRMHSAQCEWLILTDTGEDSKLVHTRILPKADASIFFFFVTRPSDEYD